VTLYLTEDEVAGLLTIEDAIVAVEECFQRLARGAIDNRPRTRLPLEDGQLAVMAAVDSELGIAGLKTYAWLPGPARQAAHRRCERCGREAPRA